MVRRGYRRERETRKARVTIGRRVGKIGFMGRGASVPARERSDVAHALSLRLKEDLVAESPQARDRCRDDALPHPRLLRSAFSRRPEAVVFPDSGQCVADVLDVCIEERTPAVPRGLGSAGLGGAVPVRGGVAIDLSRMNKVVSVDKAQSKVTVEPGCTWKKLRQEVASSDLSLRSYPSNTEGSTVGGWLSTGGYGVGTLLEGRFHTMVEAVEVAVPSGLLINATHGKGRYSLESFTGTEGQLGIVTGLTFPLKRTPERSAHFLIRLASLEAVTDLLPDLAGMDPRPLGIRILSGRFPSLLGDAGLAASPERPVLTIMFEGTERDEARFEARLKEVVGRRGLDVVQGEEARRAFEIQFTDRALALDRTAVLAGEVLVGLDRLAGFLDAVRREWGREILLDTQVVDRAYALVMTCYLADRPEMPPVVRDVSATVRTSLAAMDCGGRPYGLGIWNSPFARRALGGEFKALRVMKNETDRLGILNPGKFFALTTSGGWPVWGWTYRFGLRIFGSSLRKEV